MDPNTEALQQEFKLTELVSLGAILFSVSFSTALVVFRAFCDKEESVWEPDV